ncbi:hypothetical protein BM1_05498 [Bipolaris maydis]|nr:hypothetical protein BM1_05498 [Bipolaris maydis]
MGPWFALFEAWAVARLIRSPTFNRAVAQERISQIKLNPLVQAWGGADTLTLKESHHCVCGRFRDGRPRYFDISKTEAVQKAYRKINRLPDFEQKNGGGRTGPSSFDHFKDEVKNQFRELTWQKRPPK